MLIDAKKNITRNKANTTHWRIGTKRNEERVGPLFKAVREEHERKVNVEDQDDTFFNN